MKLTIDKIKENICETLDELDGDEVAEVYNYIRKDKIKYIEDNIWEVEGEN